MSIEMLVWNYWMWSECGEYNYKYDHDMSDHDDKDFLWGTSWDDKWIKRLFWSAEEATALSFGRSPDHVPWNDEHWGVNQQNGGSEFATNFCELRQRILDAQTQKILPLQIPAVMYAQWAEANNLPFPPALSEQVSQFLDSLMSLQQQGAPEVSKAELNARQRNNYLRVILGMARAKYSYPKGGSAKKISETLERQNLSVGDETILKFLKEAEDLTN